MDILGTIDGDNVAIEGREKMQRQMRDFFARLRQRGSWEREEIVYKVHFWRPLHSGRVHSLIEFRSSGRDAWHARATGADPMQAFAGALGSLRRIVTEMEMREEDWHGSEDAPPDGP